MIELGTPGFDFARVLLTASFGRGDFVGFGNGAGDISSTVTRHVWVGKELSLKLSTPRK
jgi:hypothetical protein